MKMRLFHYRGLENEIVPKNTTHVMVDKSVSIIKSCAFANCQAIRSVIMSDAVRRIENDAFYCCLSLESIRLSNHLEFIGDNAFHCCFLLETLFLPPTLKEIGKGCFFFCTALRILKLPDDIDLDHVGIGFLYNCNDLLCAGHVKYELDDEDYVINDYEITQWLHERYSKLPFHAICHNPSVSCKMIMDFQDSKNETQARTHACIRDDNEMTPLHILACNPDASSDAIASCFLIYPNAAIAIDNQGLTPIDYARKYNVQGLLALTKALLDRVIE